MDDQIFFMSHYIINFSFSGKALPSFFCQFVNLEQPKTIFYQAKAEEFWLLVFEVVFTFPLKCQTSKKLNKFKELVIQDGAKYTFSEPNQAPNPMCKLSRQVRQSRG